MSKDLADCVDHFKGVLVTTHQRVVRRNPERLGDEADLLLECQRPRGAIKQVSKCTDGDATNCLTLHLDVHDTATHDHHGDLISLPSTGSGPAGNPFANDAAYPTFVSCVC